MIHIKILTLFFTTLFSFHVKATGLISYRLTDRFEDLPSEILARTNNKKAFRLQFRYRYKKGMDFRIDLNNPLAKSLLIFPLPGKNQVLKRTFREISHTAVRKILDRNNDICINFFFLGLKCDEIQEQELRRSGEQENIQDLIIRSRLIARRHGRYHSRNALYHILRERSELKGELEDRLLKAAKRKNFLPDDSLLSKPREERAKIAMVFLLGLNGEKGNNAELVIKAADYAKSEGFYSVKLKASPDKSSVINSQMIRHQLITIFENPEIKDIVFVGISKGVSDFVHYFFKHASNDIQVEAREKLKVFISLAGVTRYSEIARWLRDSSSNKREIMNKIVEYKNLEKGIHSLGTSYWPNVAERGSLKENFPNLKWISVVALPESGSGITKIANPAARLLDAFARKDYGLKSPTDGLVESAAQVLPQSTDIEEYIIPLFSPHGMSKARFRDGTLFAPSSLNKDGIMDAGAAPTAGPQMINIFLRALPSQLLE